MQALLPNTEYPNTPAPSSALRFRLEMRERLALELRRQAVHVDHVVRRLAEPYRLAPPAHHGKSGPLVSASRAFVIGVRAEPYIVQAEAVEGVIQHEPGGLRAVAAAPAVLLSDQQAKLRRSMLEVHLVQTGRPDGPQCLPFIDREQVTALARAFKRCGL